MTTTYHVSGMTCAHCARAVTDELQSLAGVTDVAVDLNAGGVSEVRVTSDAPLDLSEVEDAVREAGYALAPAGSLL